MGRKEGAAKGRSGMREKVLKEREERKLGVETVMRKNERSKGKGCAEERGLKEQEIGNKGLS